MEILIKNFMKTADDKKLFFSNFWKKFLWSIYVSLFVTIACLYQK